MDHVVYFAPESAGRFVIQRRDGSPATLPIVNCERCAAMVVDTEETRGLHESFHRGWWVKPEEPESKVEPEYVWTDLCSGPHDHQPLEIVSTLTEASVLVTCARCGAHAALKRDTAVQDQT